MTIKQSAARNACILLLMMMLFLPVFFVQGEEQPPCIKLTAGDTVRYAVLENHAAAHALLAQLPLSLSFSDYNGTEKIAYLPAPLDYSSSSNLSDFSDTSDPSDVPDRCDPDVGTLAYYQPWGNLCIFYRDFHESVGLIPLGVLEGDLSALTESTEDFTVLLEAVSEMPKVQEVPQN